MRDRGTADGGWSRGIALALMMMLVPATGGRAPAAPLEPRTIKSATISNGLTLVVCEQPSAEVVATEVIVRVGSADEPAELAGAAHLLEHICWVSGGGGDPRTRIEDRGGSTNAGVLRDYTRYYATVPADDFPLALQALADMVLRPRLESPLVDRERRPIIEEVAARRDRARVRLNDLAFEQVFGESCSYARPIEGNEATLAAIQPHQLAAFHRTWYLPNNMAVVVAGRVTFESALREVEKAFSAAVKPCEVAACAS